MGGVSPDSLAREFDAVSANVSVPAAARFYVWIVRGTPLLVQLFLIFYGLPNLGIVLDAFPCLID